MGPNDNNNVMEDDPSLPDLPNNLIVTDDILDLIIGIIDKEMPPTAPQPKHVVITEQPQSKALRFRYECEGRSAGSIPGVHSTPEQKTFPGIEIRGYKGRAVVVVSCVTKDPPYRPHPHNLVGKEGCKKGVCTVEINSSTMSYTFSNLGIQCVKKKDIEEALRLREEIRVDPFKTGYGHAKQPATIDLNAIRLCFQVFLEGQQRGRFTEPLQPVVSDVIYDKKAMSDLVICKLSDVTAPVAGGREIILLCEKVAKEDIAVRFYEEQHGNIVWEEYGEFQHTNVHKQVAICFRTPRYRTLDVEHHVMVNIQLKRPSDGATSEPLPFELTPLDSGRRRFWSLKRNILKNDSPENEIFKKILLDGEVQLGNPPVKESDEVIVLDTPVAESKPIVTEQIPSDQKTTEWIERNEFDDINNNSPVSSDDNQLLSSNDSVEQQVPKEDEDKTLNELLEQVAELDEIYTDHQLRRENMIIENELKLLEKTIPTGLDGTGEKMDMDDVFDDAATYTSLQRAFKNPVPLSLGPPVPPRPHFQLELEPGVYDAVEPMLICPPSIEIGSLKRESKEDEKLPPLPPKRAKPNSQNKENANLDTGDEAILHSIIRKGSMRSLTPRPQSDQIIIMKSPDSPPNKKLPPTPPASPTKNDYGTLPKTKKSGFFSKLFSRKKSKSDLSASTTTLTQKSTPGASKEPSLANFDSNDSTRDSVRSKTSAAEKGGDKRKQGKPVARSVSSVSHKRPTTESNPDVIYIPLKGDGPTINLPTRTGSGTHLSLPGNDSYDRASTASLPPLDRRAVSALQLDVPIQDGNMELVAIADARSIKNLVEGDYGIKLDPSVDLTEAEHFALYTSIAPNAALSEFDETSAYYAPVEPGPLPYLRPNTKRKKRKPNHWGDTPEHMPEAARHPYYGNIQGEAIKTEPRDSPTHPFNFIAYRQPNDSPSPIDASPHYGNTTPVGQTSPYNPGRISVTPTPGPYQQSLMNADYLMGGNQQFQPQYTFPTLTGATSQVASVQPSQLQHQPPPLQQQFPSPANMNNPQQFNLIDTQDPMPQPGPSGIQSIPSFQHPGSIGEINISSPWLTMDSSELKSLMVNTLSDMKHENPRIQHDAETLSDSFDRLSTNLNNLSKP